MTTHLVAEIRTPDGWTFPGPHGTSPRAAGYGGTSSSVSIIAGAGEAMVIDTGTHDPGDEPGGVLDRVCRLLQDHHLTLRTILLTHWHFDHVGNAARLRQRTGAEIVCHPADRLLIENPGRIADPDRFTCADASPADVAADLGLASPADLVPSADAVARSWASFPEVTVDREISDDETMCVGPHDLQVLHTPGHTTGHVALHNRTAHSLYIGDLMYWPAPMHPYPEGVATDQEASIERCLGLGAEHLYPGHELPRCGRDDVRDYLLDLRVKQAQVRERITTVLARSGELTVHDLYPECFVVKDRYDPFDPEGVAYGIACVQSHLRGLLRGGAVTRRVSGGIARWKLV